jgi:hypothetical protein
MNSIKLFVVLLLTLKFSSSAFSISMEKDYIITKSHDTVEVTITASSFNYVKCTMNGEKKRFSSRRILGYIEKGEYYESGKFYDCGFIYRSIFMQKVVFGTLNVYGIADVQKSIMGTSANPVYLDVYCEYIRLNTNEGGLFLKLGAFWRYNLEKTMFDCDQVTQFLLTKKGYMWPNIERLVRFYNQGCAGDLNEFEKEEK